MIDAASHDARLSMLAGNRLARCPPPVLTVAGLRYEEFGTMPRLSRHCSDRAAARDALVRRQLRAVLDIPH